MKKIMINEMELEKWIVLGIIILIILIILIIRVHKENNELRKIQKELNKPYYDSIQKETEHYKRK